MYTLILIAQTFTGALAYEYGPYPDQPTCERFAEKYIKKINDRGDVLRVAPDCRLLHPELHELENGAPENPKTQATEVTNPVISNLTE